MFSKETCQMHFLLFIGTGVKACQVSVGILAVEADK